MADLSLPPSPSLSLSVSLSLSHSLTHSLTHSLSLSLSLSLVLTVWTQLCSCGMTRFTKLLTVLLQVDDIIATGR